MKRRTLLIAIATLACLAIGLFGMEVLMKMRQPPQRRVVETPGKAVRVDMVTPQAVPMTVHGFGAVRPKTEWHAVPEVSGPVLTLPPNVQSGLHVKKGELLFAIDPRPYRLAVQRIRAEIEQLSKDIDLLQQQRRNHEATLKLAQRDLRIAEAELVRDETLVQKGTIASRERDSRRQWRNRFANAVQETSNQLALIDPQIEKTRAAIGVAQAKLAEAELQLEKTRVTAPFDGQIVRTHLTRGEVVQAGHEVAVLYDTSVVEIPVTIPLDDLRWLPGLSPDILRQAAQTPQAAMLELPPATVRWHNADLSYTWQGRVQRWEAGLNEQSRTLTLVVAVHDPWGKFQPGRHPALQPGMFCEVDIQGITLPNAIVVARDALHDNNVVYLAQDNRLTSREVRVLRLLRDKAVIAAGLQAGDQVIVSPLQTPILGMKLRPQPVPKVQPASRTPNQAMRQSKRMFSPSSLATLQASPSQPCQGFRSLASAEEDICERVT
jgi:RND family efflux transporter MFP subunit